MATKMAIKDVARVQKLLLAESDRLCKLVPDKIPDKKLNLPNAIEYVPELKAAAESDNPVLRDTMRYAQMLEGNVRGTGVHACGTIICRDDITDWVPVSTADDKETGQKDARHAVRRFGDRGYGTYQDGLPGVEDPVDHQGCRGEHPPHDGQEDRYRRLLDHRRSGYLQALLRGPYRRDVPVRVPGMQKYLRGVAAVDLRGSDRHERALSARPDGLYPGFHRPKARPQSDRLRYSRHGEVSGKTPTA